MVEDLALNRTYLEVSRAVSIIAKRNTKKLNRKSLSYLLVLGDGYNEEISIREADLSKIFGDSSGSVSTDVNKLRVVGFLKEVEGHRRGKGLKLSSEGYEAYNNLSVEVKRIIEQDSFYREPIF